MYGKFKYTEDYKIQSQWEVQFTKHENSLPSIEILIPTRIPPENKSQKAGAGRSRLYMMTG